MKVEIKKLLTSKISYAHYHKNINLLAFYLCFLQVNIIYIIGSKI